MATRALQQVISYIAWNTSTSAYATGDAANHSLSWSKDGTRAAATNAAAEVDATNLPGLYKCTMTATETDCIEGVLGGKSSASNVILIPTMVAFDYLNTSAPASAGVPDVNVLNWKGSAAPANTGDAFARIGAAGAGLTALGDTRVAHLDADVSSRSILAAGAAMTLTAAYDAAKTAAAATDIVSGGAITTGGGLASADTKKMNGTAVLGTGAAGDLWRG